MDKLLRINMTNRTYSLVDLPEQYRQLGGRGLTSTIVADEVDPGVHPLGPNNKLVFAPGIVTGTSAPTSSRMSVGGKSPLTGGIKEANVGGRIPPTLAAMGLRAIVVEGQPEEKGKYWLTHITWDADKGEPKVEFMPADEYAGRNLYKVFPKLFERFGEKVNVLGIGVAGEYLYGNSGVVAEDMERRPTRYAGRGGLGAVMGSKGLKFMIFDRTGAPGVKAVNEEEFKQGRKQLLDALMQHDITKPKGGLNTYGTAVLVNIVNEAGGLPTRNFREGRFEGAAKIAGEAIFEGNKAHLAKELYNHACSPGCVIQCSNTWFDEDGKELVSCIEYESAWALGANCGIDDLNVVAELIHLCNAYGLDTIETGTTIGVAMEGGLAEFGDGKKAIKMMKEMRKGTPLGRLLGAGTAKAADALGVVRAPVVKGQSMPAYEPRAIKGIGMTYAISTMGADHTSGYTIAPEILGVTGKVDQFDRDKADMVRNFQYATAFIDSTGHCLFIAFAILDIPSGFEGVVKECNGVLGTSWTMDDVGRIGKEIIDREVAFNRGAGMNEAADRMPEFMTYEPLPPHNVVWDVPNETLDAVFGN
ncbi:MAG TPA: aldehyde ferredoxin oxidoreductase C-terminal domain-containing protein [Anaerolineae bacterium]|nr:aldehyde ferredoxin oxidoreductase C-terminal domain-containing protein [Anaerolineae bacterium]